MNVHLRSITSASTLTKAIKAFVWHTCRDKMHIVYQDRKRTQEHEHKMKILVGMKYNIVAIYNTRIGKKEEEEEEEENETK